LDCAWDGAGDWEIEYITFSPGTYFGIVDTYTFFFDFCACLQRDISATDVGATGCGAIQSAEGQQACLNPDSAAYCLKISQNILFGGK
jgi:hypothetical protein